MKDVRTWAMLKKSVIEQAIEKTRSVESDSFLYTSAQLDAINELLAWLDEPEERVFHMGGFWGDVYYDQDGVPEWEPSHRKEPDGD